MRRFILLAPLAVCLFVSCLSLSGELTVYSPQSYELTLDYSVRNDFARIKYLADNRSVMVLPLTREEWLEFIAPYEGVSFQTADFQRIEGEDRMDIRARIIFADPSVLEELLSCRVVLEGGNPNVLTLTFDRGSGEPSEEAVTYINGYCAGEIIDFTVKGSGGETSSGSWSLRELLLETEAPALSYAWEE